MTRSSMFSPTQKADKELLLEIGFMVETLVKYGHYDVAEGFGEPYEQLSNRLATHDYTKEDESINRLKWIFMSHSNTQLPENLLQRCQQAKEKYETANPPSKQPVSLGEVISRQYGSRVENFLRDNTLSPPPHTQ